MATGYEVAMYRNIERIALATERIANALEQQVYGVTGASVRAARERLMEDAMRQEES